MLQTLSTSLLTGQNVLPSLVTLEIKLIVDLAGLSVLLKLLMIESVLKKKVLIPLFYPLLILVLVVICSNVSLKDVMVVKLVPHGLGSKTKELLLEVKWEILLPVILILCLNAITMLKIQNILIVLMLNKSIQNVTKNVQVMELIIKKINNTENPVIVSVLKKSKMNWSNMDQLLLLLPFMKISLPTNLVFMKINLDQL